MPFKDFRGYNVTWSGNKSFHIHFIFDTTHLSRAVIDAWCRANNKGVEAKLRDHYQGTDLSNDALMSYYSERWHQVATAGQAVLGQTVSFDQQLSNLHQKRRLPWGSRTATDGNILGIPPGTTIPQIVIAEKITSRSPRNAGRHFLSAEDGNRYIRQPVRRHRGLKQQRAKVVPGPLLDRLKEYLREQWQREYPKPVSIEGGPGEWLVNFINHMGDNRPSTICKSPMASLLPGGRGALPPRSKDLRLPHGQTIDEILAAIQNELTGKGVYRVPEA